MTALNRPNHPLGTFSSLQTIHAIQPHRRELPAFAFRKLLAHAGRPPVERRKRLLLAFLMTFWVAILHAQQVGQAGVPGINSSSVNYVTAAPSGACSPSSPLQVVNSSGAIYVCKSGTWASAAGSGGTLNSVTGTAGQIDVTNPSSSPVISLDPAFTNAGGALTGSFPSPELAAQTVASVTAAQKAGTADASAALQACLTAAATSPYPECYIPAGTYTVATGLTCSSAVSCKIRGAGADVTSIAASGTGYNTLVVGNGAGNQATPTGYTTGLHLIGATIPGSPSGISAFQLNGMVQYRVDDVNVSRDDIGVDLINNNYGAQFTNLRACFGATCNVGVYLRTGNQSGSDISFFNPWVAGIIAGFSMSGGGGGYHIYGGQVGAGLTSGSGVDTSAGILFGRDYLSPGTLGEVSMDVYGTSFEGVDHAWVFRGFNQVHLTTTGVYANPTQSGAPAIGFYKNSQANNSNVQLDGTTIGGYWGATLISDTTTYASDLFIENGTYSAANLPSINGTQTYITSMAQQSGITYAIVNNSLGLSAPTITDTGLTPSTSPICPHGTNGAFTTTGCATGGGGSLPGGTQGELLTNTSGSTTYATSQILLDASQFSGGIAEKVNACITAAIAIGGTCDARALGEPLVPGTGIAAAVTTDEQINVGNSSGDPVTLLLPASFYWIGGMTDGTSCTLAQYPNTSIIGQGTPSGNAGVFGAGNSSNLGYVYCTKPIAGANAADYFYAFGFSIFNNNNGSQFHGHATANNVGAMFQGPIYDNSNWDHLLVLDAMDTYASEFTGLCCTSTISNSSFNTNYSGIPVYILSQAPLSGVFALNFVNDSIVHNLPGSPVLLMQDTYNNHSTVNFTNIYSEVDNASPGIVEFDGVGIVNIANWHFSAENGAGAGPVIETTATANTVVNVSNLNFSNAGGSFTYPLTGISQAYNSASVVANTLTSSGAAYIPYWSTNGTPSLSVGTSGQFAVASSGAVTTSGTWNLLHLGYYGTHNATGTVFNLPASITGSGNEAFGEAEEDITSGSDNTSMGQYACGFMTTGNDCTGFGYQAGEHLTGNDNTAIGYDAGVNGSTLVTNSQSTFVGSGANASANGLTNSTAIGYNAQATASNQMVFGNGSVTSNVFNGTISATGGLANGVTAVTQSAGDTSSLVATNSFVANALAVGRGCTSGCNYFVGTADSVTLPPPVTGGTLAASNQPQFVQFWNNAARSVGNGCIYVSTASPGGHIDVGLYSISGATGTLQWHTGAQSTSTTGTLCVTPTQYTLVGGQNYYAAWCADNTTATVAVWQNGGIAITMMASSLAPAHVAGVDATDTCNGGVLPSTITTTNITNTATNVGFPLIYANN